ncbi:MAG TPA: hypothetical protein VF706_03205 [Solirubrobacteraceae bacterium]
MLSGALIALGWCGPAQAGTTMLDAVAEARLTIQGPPDGSLVDNFAAIPNLTGDGRPALAVTTTDGAPGRLLAGIVYVLFATPRTGTVSLGDPTLRGFKILGARAYDEAGYEITAAGDVNGDGRGDLLLTAPRNGFVCASAGSGPCGNAPHFAYVVYGKADERTVDLARLRRSQGFAIKGVPGGGLLGEIAGLGRFDGSRYGAIAVAADRYTYAIYGRRDPADVDLAHLGPRGFRITTAPGRGASAPFVGAAGDVNGDGRPDLPLHERSIKSARHAGVFVLLGRHYTGTIALSRLGTKGFAVAGAIVGTSVGDVNGDHRADLLVERAATPTEFDIVYGSRSPHRVDLASLGAGGERLLYGPVPAGYVLQPNVLAGLGDLNRDGLADVGISTETYPGGNGPFQGTVSVVFGSRLPGSLSLQSLGPAGYQLSTAVPPPPCPGGPIGNELGHTLGAVGDFSGDGRPEFAVSALGLGPVPAGPICHLRQGEVLVEALPAS